MHWSRTVETTWLTSRDALVQDNVTTWLIVTSCDTLVQWNLLEPVHGHVIGMKQRHSHAAEDAGDVNTVQNTVQSLHSHTLVDQHRPEYAYTLVDQHRPEYAYTLVDQHRPEYAYAHQGES